MSVGLKSAIAVLDVGKSNVRLCVIDGCGEMLAFQERGNRVIEGPPYPHFDVYTLFDWMVKALANLVKEFDIHTIVPVTHGACAALIDDSGLALPILDYEFNLNEIDSEYDALARDFARTASPKLPAGLNLGRQLFWLERNFPAEFRGAKILPYPQYWAWRLSEKIAWEATSLGCHTDLWNPRENKFSAFAEKMGWDKRFGARVNAWTALGPVRTEIRAATGLAETCEVLAGIHDSNASYLAHRATRDSAFAVVSTGTWIVVMAGDAPLDRLREDRDMLANVDAFGDPVPTARFMGGREYSMICGDDALEVEPSLDDVEAVLALGTLALPSFSEQGGPFRFFKGRIEGTAPPAAARRAAMAAIYCAMMTDYCLDMLETRGDVIVEGRFAANAAFCSTLSALRSPGAVRRSSDETGTLRGAAILSALARGERPEVPPLSLCTPHGGAPLASAKAKWRRLLPMTTVALQSIGG